MPDESCRNCGGSLVNCSMCPSCRKITQKICHNCGSKTQEHIHSNCLYLESSQSRNGMQLNVVGPINSKKTDVNKIYTEKTLQIRNTLLVFTIVSLIVLGFATNHFIFPQTQTSNAQTINTISQQSIKTHDVLLNRSFENCLGYGSVQSITVMCPTEFGYVYRTILNMPGKLASEFSGQVFSIRGISITEYSDGSAVLEYHKNSYTTNYFAN